MSHPNDASPPEKLGFSGSVARAFQSNAITPLLALVALLLGLFAVLVTPREEEPQINVTMANVIIPFPGASSADVEKMVAAPAEHVLSQIQGIEHSYSVARPGVAVLTVQFKVGVPRTEALVRLYDVLNANQDWLPQGLGVLTPIVKPKGIDDVPVLAATLWTKDAQSAMDLERVAHAVETELKRVPGTREVVTIGGPGRAVHVWLEPAKLRERGVSVQALQGAIASANQAMPSGSVVNPSPAAGEPGMLSVETGEFLQNAKDVGDIVVGVSNGRPIYLREVARVEAGAQLPQRYVWFTPGAADAAHAGQQGQNHPAVTITVTKKPGENAVDVAAGVRERLDNLKNTVIPDDVEVAITRDYGETAAAKANKLIQKLIFATGSVIILVGLALGRREAVIVGAAVILTLTATLFASWAWGFTLNRVSLFALIFSIGILVDDAIVVVENIHRHRMLTPDVPLSVIIPRAVDEVGGPTILATFTVIAALLPMAFVSGLMGPYMSPIPINASMGMAISLAIAFTVTPWLALKLTKTGEGHAAHGPGKITRTLQNFFTRTLTPLLQSAKKRWLLAAGIGIGLLLSVSLALVPNSFVGVVLKMLPFDNKSEYQVVVDMPAGTPLENTTAALQEMTAYLSAQPEVANVQGYAGTASPITFNGLVRQYYLRAEAEGGDLQVNLIDAHDRSEQSHAIAQRHRPGLEKIAASHGARVKVVEVPPGPPVMSPIVAEVYGPDQEGRAELALRVAEAYKATPDIVGVDTSLKEHAPRAFLRIQRQRAESLGIPVQVIAQTVYAALSGSDAAYLHDGHAKFAVPVRLQLPLDQQVGLDALLALPLKAANGAMVPLSELVTVERGVIDQPRYTKDMLPVTYVFGDMAGSLDSPLYGLFGIRTSMDKAALPNTGELGEYWISQPKDPYRQYAVKWDGEWQITYETFRDMGAAYGVGLILIYLLVVAQFKSYLTPLIIMAPIPLTIIGVMPGHALLNAQYTATSMIGMIALAGIIVRNSILLVDFIELETQRGVPFAEAVVQSAAVRAQPIALTGLAAMMGAFFILDDPIFNGLAVSLIFGIAVSTLLTLVVIPVLYYAVYRRKYEALAATAT
ncbi:MAG TPA: multidrug transporter AcrB [Hydrogenophaga sp.]|uniref:efflux RND transporter permease subunit n=1 Tax=Hydrogenophaga sp. TaxID=1904254 RepID=UPI0008B448BA|nr:efflux RND transporter permease subunit [Hydrogenophaga sp.]MBU4181280.1 efflux RND transporter permease subunit [Gammaproteobacteria bacterium]OGA74720.1 MAG: multidrug transporter AcrB [Burkholderiales bacterium GWE1_65_30]OGA91821.1 MAG: multidrug transporter AcrB [Burkholderiales bacterium GWF1_66_17]PKO76027.1 MAG: multidrug transporter AcrB [Betaproteobacteria bacterium HGW-Betaproteobacteria-15]MBU4281358.1 efflux RND transporter permease subunit [Gammaproteobacteria bacterium]